MPVEPTNRIYGIPIIKKEENVGLSQQKRQKPRKKEQKKESRKIDIKV